MPWEVFRPVRTPLSDSFSPMAQPLSAPPPLALDPCAYAPPASSVPKYPSAPLSIAVSDARLLMSVLPPGSPNLRCCSQQPVPHPPRIPAAGIQTAAAGGSKGHGVAPRDFAKPFSHCASLTATFPPCLDCPFAVSAASYLNVVHVLLFLSWQAIPPLRRHPLRGLDWLPT